MDVEKFLKLDLEVKKKWIKKVWIFLLEIENKYLIE